MRVGIISSTAVAYENRLDAAYYLGSAGEEARLAAARERIRKAIRFYRNLQATARKRAEHRARLASKVQAIT